MKKKQKKLVWSLEDAAHWIIYRELDKLRIPFPYEKATKICNELRNAISYRSPIK